MKLKIFAVIFFTASFSSFVFAQGNAAIPFLLLPTSPSLSAMGATGTSLPTDDPFGFLVNPAQLGFTSQQNNLSFLFYPSNVKWAGIDQLKLSGLALNAGYNFKNLIGIPLSVGFGFSNPELSYGEFNFTGKGDPTPIKTVEPKDSYNAYSFGIGIDYYVMFSAGITFKNVSSEIPDVINLDEPGLRKAEVNAVDYGFLLNIPVIRLINDELSFNLFENIPAKPYFNLSFGYAQSNIGDEIIYFDPAQADPIPRTGRLGYGISTGLFFEVEDVLIKALGFEFTVDADDMLIVRDSTGKYDYQSFLGDIDFGKNVIQIKGDDNVVSRAGLKIELLETVGIYSGHFDGRGYDMRKTNGFEIRLKGFMKMLDKFTDDPVVKYISDHFDIRYYNTRYFVDHFLETKIEGISLFISGY